MHAFYMYSKWASLRVSLGQWNSPNIIYSLSLTWYHGTMLPYSYQVGHFNSNACMHTCTVYNVQYYVPYNQKLSRDKNFVHESRGAKKEKYFSRQKFPAILYMPIHVQHSVHVQSSDTNNYYCDIVWIVVNLQVPMVMELYQMPVKLKKVSVNHYCEYGKGRQFCTQRYLVMVDIIVCTRW